MIAPYYQDEFCTIYNADCRDVLPQLDQVDLVLTDPPYGTDVAEWDKTFPTDWMELAGQKANKAMSFSPGTNNILNCPRKIAEHSYRWMLAPVMPGAATHGLMGFSNWLPFLVYSKDGVPIYKAQQDFKIIASPSYRVKHPSPKPLDCMKWLLNALPKAETILDPFMGGGTTLRAAKDLGLKAIGIEINEAYCQIAVERLRQGTLFDAMNQVQERESLRQVSMLDSVAAIANR